MDLPNELWQTILKKIKSKKLCDKFYEALPSQTKIKLEESYKNHRNSLNIPFIFTFSNKLSLYDCDILEKEIPIKNIIAVRYVKDWNTIFGRKNCIVIAKKNGMVIFWDADTLEYIEGINTESNLDNIEFHPKKPIMLTVEAKVMGKKMKVWNFDEGPTTFTVILEFLGDDKKLYYFHPSESKIYIFTLNYTKLSKVYFYNYDSQSIGFSHAIHSYLYLNNFYTPLKISEDGSFECIKFFDFTKFFCKFLILDDDIKEIQNIILFKNPFILDFLRIGDDIYFQEISYNNETIIYKYSDEENKIIYKTSGKIIKLVTKNNLIIFVENKVCYIYDLRDNQIENFSLEEEPIGLCIM